MIKRAGFDKIRDMFEKSFDEQVGQPNGMGDCEAKIVGEKDNLHVEVSVTGMAGSPSIDDFKSGKVKGGDKVSINWDRDVNINFKLAPSKTASMSINDFVIVYELVK